MHTDNNSQTAKARVTDDYILLAADPRRVTDEELESMLASLPEWRRQQAMRYKFREGRLECALAYCLLRDLLRAHHPEVLLADGHIPAFLCNEHGKPSLPGGFPHFSLTHCKTCVAAAVSDRPIGVDAERVRRRVTPQLIRYTMNEAEQQLIAGSTAPDVTFTSLWTRKEALVKCFGTGLAGGIPALLTEELPHHPDLRAETFPHPAEDYVLSVVY